MKQLVKLVQQWSSVKGLDVADSRGQYLKIIEEVGEVAAGLARSDIAMIKDGIGDVMVTLIIYSQQRGFDIDFTQHVDPVLNRDSAFYICDILSTITSVVTHDEDRTAKYCVIGCIDSLNSLAVTHNTTLHDCLQLAYNEIKHRTGRMVGGVFVKSDDLPKPEYKLEDWDKTDDRMD